MKVTEAVFAGSSADPGGRPSRRLAEFAFIGRSNVGKSSLINMLCGARELARTSSNPGKTLCINHFLINGSWYMVDLPGYGFARVPKKTREKLQVMIQDYIGKSDELKMLFILIDSRHDLQKIDGEFIRAVDGARVPYAIVFTKCDKMGVNAVVSQTGRTAAMIRAEVSGAPRLFTTSSLSQKGRAELLDYIETML